MLFTLVLSISRPGSKSGGCGSTKTAARGGQRATGGRQPPRGGPLSPEGHAKARCRCRDGETGRTS
ncbi:hypothetical protein chiPu_0023639, partial [Chiloscyllium punctatum]|nr:hypothetical protein [Chiloscyllium punctatum]